MTLPSDDILRELDVAYLGFGRALIAAMVRWELDKPAPIVHHSRLVFGDGTYHLEERDRVDHGMAVGHRIFEIFEWPIAEACALLHFQHDVYHYAHLADDQGMPIHPSLWEFPRLKRFIINYLMFDYVLQAIAIKDGLDLSDAELLKPYHDIRPYLRASIVFKWHVPLVNLEGDLAEDVQISSNFKLCRFPDEAKNAIWGDTRHLYDGFDHAFPAGILSKIQYCLRMDEVLEDRDHLAETITEEGRKRHRTKMAKYGKWREALHDEARNVISALNLTAKGCVFAPLAYKIPAGPGRTVSNIDTLGDPLPRHFIDQPPMGITLDLNAASQVQGRVASLQRMDERRHSDPKRTDISTALRRFNQAFSRDTYEDKLIDLAVAMEASLLAGESTELAYKAKMRGAALLAGDRDPLSTGGFINKFYDARSKIVHDGLSLADYCDGNQYCKDRGLNPARFIDECEDVVRAILDGFLSLLDAKPDVRFLKEHAVRVDATLLHALGPRVTALPSAP